MKKYVVALIMLVSSQSFSAEKGDYSHENGRIYHSESRKELTTPHQYKVSSYEFSLRNTTVDNITESIIYKGTLVVLQDNGRVWFWSEKDTQWLQVGSFTKHLYIQDGVLSAETNIQGTWIYDGEPSEFIEEHLDRSMMPVISRIRQLAFRQGK